MPRYILSRHAVDDVAELAYYGIEQFGYRQAKHYQRELLTTLERLAENPNLGRSAEIAGQALRRYPYRPYVILYTPADGTIVVERIMHMARLKGSLEDDLDLP